MALEVQIEFLEGLATIQSHFALVSIVRFRADPVGMVAVRQCSLGIHQENVQTSVASTISFVAAFLSQNAQLLLSDRRGAQSRRCHLRTAFHLCGWEMPDTRRLAARQKVLSSLARTIVWLEAADLSRISDFANRAKPERPT